MSLLDNLRKETAKQRSLRVPLDCAKKQHWVSRWKLAGALLAGLAAVGYCGWVSFAASGVQHLNPGHVAGVHSAWEHDCQACHEPGIPQRADGSGALFFGGFFTEEAGIDPRPPSDRKCIACHAGPPHHPLQICGEVQSCAACHPEHQGRAAELVRFDDHLCTRCHGDIKNHRLPNKSSHTPAVDDVVDLASHPKFRVPTSANGVDDPGNIKFSHYLHLLPGQAEEGAKDQIPKLLQDLPSEFRGRYRTPVDSDLVLLDCGDCHQLDQRSLDHVPGEGAYMQPIYYEQHCRACHQLPVVHRLEKEDLRAAAMALRVQPSKEPNQPVPDVVKNPDLDLTSRPLTPLTPIERVIPGQPLAAIHSSTTQDVGTELLKSKCDLCHTLAKEQQAMGADLSPKLDVLLAKIPTVWFDSARFDHAAHRTVSCGDCHAEVGSRDRVGVGDIKYPVTFRDDDAIFLPDLQKCASCHAPGKARSDCAECHRYHAVDKSPHGVGATVRGVAERKSSDKYMPRKLPPAGDKD